MAPALNHPSAVAFLDEHHRPVHGEPADYYGGKEHFSRSRTYSAVCTFVYAITLAYTIR